MTDSAIGDSTVTSPIIGGNLVDDSVQMLSPTRHRGSFDNLPRIFSFIRILRIVLPTFENI